MKIQKYSPYPISYSLCQQGSALYSRKQARWDKQVESISCLLPSQVRPRVYIHARMYSAKYIMHIVRSIMYVLCTDDSHNRDREWLCTIKFCRVHIIHSIMVLSVSYFFKYLGGRVKLYFHVLSRNNRTVDGAIDQLYIRVLYNIIACHLYRDKQFCYYCSHLGDFMKGTLRDLSIGVILEHLGRVF